jgi:hypothetical protein
VAPGDRSHRWFWAFFGGVLLTQVAWTLALPAYRGIDEFDHVYRASSVAHGELISRTRAPDGRGNLVTVSTSVVRAASQVCSWYRYTKPDDCRVVGPADDGVGTVSSAAALYDPVWYAVVGYPTRPLPGEWVVYGIRLLSGLICAALIGWSAVVVRRWATGPLPLLAHVVALSPVFVFSTAIASPNGAGYAAALLVWVSLVGAIRTGHLTRETAMPLAVGAAIELVAHSTGPLWLLLIGLVVLPLRSWRSWIALVSRSRGALAWLVPVILLVGVGTIGWTLWSGANSVGPPDPTMPPLTWHIVLREAVLWQFQSIAAFPTRNEPAPVLVYALWALLFLLLVVWAVRVADGRHRIALALLAVLAVAVPEALMVQAWDFAGSAWQGRYTLPLTVGFLVLAGDALDRAGARLPAVPTWGVAAAIGLGVATSVGFVGHHEVVGGASGSPIVGIVPLGWLLAAAVAGLASALPVVAIAAATRGDAAGRLPSPPCPGST